MENDRNRRKKERDTGGRGERKRRKTDRERGRQKEGEIKREGQK